MGTSSFFGKHVGGDLKFDEEDPSVVVGNKSGRRQKQGRSKGQGSPSPVLEQQNDDANGERSSLCNLPH